MGEVVRRITVEGRVQGVGFRAFVGDAARRQGVRGWVRNRRDGSVEAVLAGDPAAVDAVIQRCRRGPGAARVWRVEVSETADAIPPEAGFRARPTV